MSQVVEVWTYRGRRLNRDGSASHEWADAEGDLCRFGLKVGRRATTMRGVIGARYEVTVTTEGGHGRGDYQGPSRSGGPALLAEWTALDGLVTAHEAARLSERRLARVHAGAHGDMTLADLADLRAGLPRTQRAALDISVLSLIRRGW